MVNDEGEVKVFPTYDDGQGGIIYNTGIDNTTRDAVLGIGTLLNSVPYEHIFKFMLLGR